MGKGERTAFGPQRAAEQSALAREWRRLGRAATFVAVLTSPAVFAWLYSANEWPLVWSLLGTFVLVIAFRGFVDVVAVAAGAALGFVLMIVTLSGTLVALRTLRREVIGGD